MNSSNKEPKKEIKIKEDPKTTKYYINTNNKIMNEIQELLTDQDIIKKKLIEENNEYYVLELLFPEEITQKNMEIKFLLMVNKEHPHKEPQLYCITVFCHPHLCDGRNLLKNVINCEWEKTKIPLETIVNKIPRFIIKYNEYKYDESIVGNYVLGQYYKITFLKSLPIYFYLISNENKILTISDISLCEYEIDNNMGYCKLSFFIDIKYITEVKSKKNKNIIIIKYKNPLNNKKTQIEINTSDYETIKAILDGKIKIYQKKSGKLPDIDINKVEKEIEEKEKEIKGNNINIEKSLYLMSLYQKAVEYYSAVNNQKFIDITHKIHQLLINTQLNTSSSDETAKKEIEADKNINKVDKNEKDIKKDISNDKIENKIENKNKEDKEKEDKEKEEKNQNEIKEDNKNMVKNEIQNEIQNEKKEKEKEIEKEKEKEEKQNENLIKKEDNKKSDEKENDNKDENNKVKEDIKINDEKNEIIIKKEINQDNKNDNNNDVNNL